MGAFDAIPADGRSISAQELADKLAVEKKLVGMFPHHSLEIDPY